MDLLKYIVLLLLCLFNSYTCLTKFKVEVLDKGNSPCERKSKYGDQVFVHFVGTKLSTGEEFDRSHADKPYRFQLGLGEVIEGFEEGLLNMCPGEKRKLTIPPNMAYGMKGGSLPQMPGGTLIFEVELVHAEEGPRHPKVFKNMDLDGDKFLTSFEVLHWIKSEIELAGAIQLSPSDEREFVEQVMLAEDKNKDGKVSFVEFCGNKHDEL